MAIVFVFVATSTGDRQREGMQLQHESFVQLFMAWEML